MDYKELTEIQLDALQEIGNIGAGNAATALSQMIRKRIDITVPHVDVLPLEDVISKIGAPEDKVTAVVLRIFGDAPGNVVLLTTEESSSRIIKLLTGQQADGELNEFQLSAMQEIGNILAGAYINSVVQVTGLSMITSVPAVSYDMLYSLITTVFVESGQYEEYMISIESKFLESNREIKGFFFYIPVPGSLERIIQALGLI